MKSTGIVRKLDNLGRVVIPIEVRKTLEIEERDGLEIFVQNDRIILQKYQPSYECLFCRSSQNVSAFKGKSICKDCLESITQKKPGDVA
ncbi:AbrB/MazE/SpoVT family DNA-binding domain-containing protein [Pelosinus propionicus]|uniref:Transcriptional pleiotropic regulator of transition state genes n=1 Tax=Pelosinus propionicus DSM 13327 TaxID=1123291 RepID=A0A1I4P248_9FIRM|nr:AbrB/MazE/SpoVT family DNA-binding domain-containing protein [Pelosinus propionicus]SFM21914.1 transcriptional pleiotropic regulator of transition state genes [Pelosinus propionicus DSM 13327]